MPTPSTLVSRNVVLDTILTFLERIIDERFWEGLIGQRLVELGKRYFGNDFVVLSLVYYIASLLRTKWWDLVETITDKMRRPDPSTVSVQLITSDKAYIAVDDFVRSKIRELDGLDRVFATYEDVDVEDGNGDDNDDVNKKKIVTFYPPEETTSVIEYKGHTLSVSWKSVKKAKDDEEQIEGGMFRGRFVSRTLIITMEDTNLDTLKQFIQEWTDMYNERQSNELTVHKYNNSYSSWDFFKSMEPRALSTVVLKKGVKEGIVNDMDKFRRRKRWYKTRGVPYRRGYLLYGPPGTGKTSLIQALASNLGMDIGIASLSDFYNDSDFSDMLNDTPSNCIVVLEDFDHYIKNVSARNERISSSIAGILNALDGIQGQSGSMIFMTANDISKIPPALLRPGRMDLKMELGYADSFQVQEMFWQFFGHDPDTLETVTEGEHKEFLLRKKVEFADRIPESYVTTAELENYFITLWMTADAQNPEKGLYARIFDGIPEFLEKVKMDREQAKEHERKKKEESSKKKEEDEATEKNKEDEEKEKENSAENQKDQQEEGKEEGQEEGQEKQEEGQEKDQEEEEQNNDSDSAISSGSSVSDHKEKQ